MKYLFDELLQKELEAELEKRAAEVEKEVAAKVEKEVAAKVEKEVAAKVEKEMAAKVEKEMAAKVEKEVATTKQETEQATLLSSIKNLMTNLKLSVEQAMDALCIPQAQREAFVGLVK